MTANNFMHVSVCVGGSISVGQIPRSETAGLKGMFISKFARYSKIVLQRSCVNLYSDQQF